jgi:hypothetical protein
VIEDQPRCGRGADAALPASEQSVAHLRQRRQVGAEQLEQRGDAVTAGGVILEQGRALKAEAIHPEQSRLALIGRQATAEFLILLAQHLSRELTVGHRVGEAVAHQLVVLDQPVIGVLRKGQRRQVEGVDDRAAQQRQRRRQCPQRR